MRILYLCKIYKTKNEKKKILENRIHKRPQKYPKKKNLKEN